MKILSRTILFLCLLFVYGSAFSQDLNYINGSGFNIAVGPGAVNTPQPGAHHIGLQSELDVNYRWQMTNAHGTDNFYLRRHVFGWSSWFKIWHSGNLNRADMDFLAKNVTSAEKVKSTYLEVYKGGNDAGRIEGFNAPEQSNLLGMNFLTAVGFSQTGTTYQQAMSLRRFWNGSAYTSRLSVDGEVIAKEVKVQVSVPADYVFEPTYRLMPIEDLGQYMKVNKHLPKIPSAAEIVENGWEVGEMSNLLLEKIEELSLYVIQLNERNKVLEERVNYLQRQIK